MFVVSLYGLHLIVTLLYRDRYSPKKRLLSWFRPTVTRNGRGLTFAFLQPVETLSQVHQLLRSLPSIGSK